MTGNFPDPTLVERMKVRHSVHWEISQQCRAETDYVTSAPPFSLLQIICGDPQTDPKVKKTLMSVLKGFHDSYRDDRSLKVYAEWWDAVGGARGVSAGL